MNQILAIPLPLRVALAFALGALLAGFMNLAIYRLAWQQRSISPWSAPPEGIWRRRWLDRLPFYGWWALRRERAVHGPRFWIRPLAVELLSGLLFAALYLWDTRWVPLDLMNIQLQPPPLDFLSENLPLVTHMRFASHALLVSLLVVVSLIDIDEQTIPDGITVPGTLIGLALAAIYPWSVLPAGYWAPFVGGRGQPVFAELMTLTSPEFWPAALGGLPRVAPLAIGLACLSLWCFGLLPRRWNTSRGLKTAIRVFAHRLQVTRATYVIGAIWLATSILIVLAASQAPAANWAGLLSALVGMAAGASMIWAVRIVAAVSLRREAMGFGDVTLLAMIGAFVGWQAAVVVFFVAPFAGLLLGIAKWVAHGEREIPYGPFLCLAALLVIVDWSALWPDLQLYFSLGWLLPAVLAIGLPLMGLPLWLLRVARERMSGEA